MLAATGTSLVQMRVSKVVGFTEDDESSEFVVLEDLDGDQHLVIQIGHPEAFGLAATLGGLEFGRPMTYPFAAGLVHSLGGRVREVRLDRVVGGAYAATVELEGPRGLGLVDARSSDALNLAVLVDAPIFVAPEMLDDCIRREEGDSAEAMLMRRALTSDAMTIRRLDG
jgi:bifunctional DNase/RNase